MWEHESFANGLQDGFVFLYLDFPAAEEIKAMVPNPERNEELQQKYSIRGFPTVLLMTSDGEVFGQTGYQEGGPEKYVEHVQALTASGKKALVAVAELEKAYEAAEDKAAIVTQAVELLASLEDGAAGSKRIAALVRKGFELDPDNKAGLKLNALKALFDSGMAEETEFGVAEAMDPKNEEGLYEKAVMARMMGVMDEATATAFIGNFKTYLALGKVHDTKEIQGSCATVAMWCDRFLDDAEGAKFFAEKAKSFGELEEEMKEMIEEILKKGAV